MFFGFRLFHFSGYGFGIIISPKVSFSTHSNTFLFFPDSELHTQKIHFLAKRAIAQFFFTLKIDL